MTHEAFTDFIYVMGLKYLILRIPNLCKILDTENTGFVELDKFLGYLTENT